ncbi:MAG TPA: hypothetical protein VN088_15760, partial [Nocardioides sp.]|nr:hypothetical protein [Nocardioides sp.]
MGAVADYIQSAVLFTAAMSALFVVEYTALAPWWRHRMGRAIVAFDAAIMLALLPAALHYLFGLSVASAFFAWYDGTSLLGAGLITGWRMVVIW